jgi:hypothetical protein
VRTCNLFIQINKRRPEKDPSVFELLFRYKDSMVLNSICFESKHELYAFVKKENIEVEQIIDKQEIQ